MTQITVTNLDFDTIRSQLKDWMRSNDTFKDYDFEASGLSFMLDVMAYNTQYNAVLANFMANEMFLDSAVKRNSIMSHAKALGYHPRGFTAARAKVSLTIDSLYVANGLTAPDNFILRRGTQFTSNVDGTYYSFVTSQDYSAAKAIDGTYTFGEIELVEGLFNTFSWVVNSDMDGQTYVIPNSRVDVASMSLMTYPNALSVNGTTWAHSNSIFTQSDNIFFTQEISGDKTEIYFGNGAVGAKPAVNSIIRLEYITCNGKSGNGAKAFTVSGSLLHDNSTQIYASDYTLNLVTPSQQGADAETNEEIKFHASKHFAVQNRAVTAYDYESIIRENFYNVESIKVWGGEDNNPPMYNSVVICIKPNYSEYLTDAEKDTIRGILKQSSVMNIKPVFVDPDYINVKINSIVKYSLNKLPIGSDLSALVKNTIINYSDVFLEAFNQNLIYSSLMKEIDASSASIVGNLTSLSLSKYVTPILGSTRSYTVNFSNPISNVDMSVISTDIMVTNSDVPVKITNIGDKLFMIYYDEQGRLKRISEAGTIDYVTGLLNLNAINVTYINNSTIEFVAVPLYNDISALQNNVLRINPYDITITTTAV